VRQGERLEPARDRLRERELRRLAGLGDRHVEAGARRAGAGAARVALLRAAAASGKRDGGDEGCCRHQERLAYVVQGFVPPVGDRAGYREERAARPIPSPTGSTQASQRSSPSRPALSARAAATLSAAHEVGSPGGSATSPDIRRLSTTSSARSVSFGNASST